MIVTGEQVAVFLAKALQRNVVPPYTAVGTERDGEIINGVLINHFTGHDVHVSVAGRGWSREIIVGVGEYIFDKLLCERMTMITEQPRVIALALKFGGEIEGRLRNHFGPDRDGTIIGILKSDWPF